MRKTSFKPWQPCKIIGTYHWPRHSGKTMFLKTCMTIDKALLSIIKSKV